MPKIDLLNSATGLVESFEPVDAREALQPPTLYVPAHRAEVDRFARPERAALNVPQVNLVEQLPLKSEALKEVKYGRSDVVKAEVGNPARPEVPRDASGRVSEEFNPAFRAARIEALKKQVSADSSELFTLILEEEREASAIRARLNLNP